MEEKIKRYSITGITDNEDGTRAYSLEGEEDYTPSNQAIVHENNIGHKLCLEEIDNIIYEYIE